MGLFSCHQPLALLLFIVLAECQMDRPPSFGIGKGAKFNPRSLLNNFLTGLRSNCSEFSEQISVDQCIWLPSQSYEEYPDECKTIPLPAAMPQIIRSFVEAKQEEYVKLAQDDLKKRGAPENCGMCSYKAKCRNRTSKDDSFFCSTVERTIELADECNVEKACVLEPDEKMGCVDPMLSGIPLQTEGDDLGLLLLTLGQLFPLDGVGLELPSLNLGGKLKKAGEFLESLDISQVGSITGGPAGGIGVDASDLYGTDFRRRRKKRQPPNPHSGEDKAVEGLTALFDDLAKEARKDMINQWNCRRNKAGDKCLCCCGVHFPDAETETCVDVTDDVREYIIGEVKKMTRGSLRNFIRNILSDLFRRKRRK